MRAPVSGHQRDGAVEVQIGAGLTDLGASRDGKGRVGTHHDPKLHLGGDW